MGKMAESYTLLYQESVESTQESIKLALNNAGNGLVGLYAGTQTAGRGRGVSKWHDSPGRSLLMSVAVHWEKPPIHPFDINRWFCGVLQSVLPKTVAFKWPNDLMVGDKKLGGILIENQWSGAQMHRSIIGLGLNLNASVADLDRAIAMNTIDPDNTHQPEEWAHKILSALAATPFHSMPRLHWDKIYQQRLWGTGQEQPYLWNGTHIHGTVVRTTPEGMLVLALNNGQRRVFDLDEITWDGLK